MRVNYPTQASLIAIMTPPLIIVTGGCFALLCFFIMLAELLFKLIALPAIFLLGMTTLVYGYILQKMAKIK